nr:MAG: ORF1 [Torque teno polar bear virus 7]
MPYRRRRSRPYRRRRFPRRRHFFRYNHPFYRRWRGRWFRRRNPPVRQPKPRFIKNFIVQGVEVLGIQGSEVSMYYDHPQEQDDDGHWRIDVKNIAPTNRMVSYLSKMIPPYDNSCTKFTQVPEYWDFVGGYGFACFSLYGLIMRMILGFARANRTLDRATLIKFLGVHFSLQRAPQVNYLFLPQYHRNLGDFIQPLITPINLINTPGTVTVNSIQRTKCCKSPFVRRKADPTVSGWHDLETFLPMPLQCYLWTVFNPTNPMGRNPQITKDLRSPIQNTWFKDQLNKPADTYCPPWNDREKYDRQFVDNIDNIQITKGSWWDYVNSQNKKPPTPQLDCAYGKYAFMLPPVIATDAPQTLWFKYKFFFKVAGKSVGFSRQRWPIKEADTCPNCPNRDCDACIKPKRDLKKSGLLTKKAFKRITQPPNTTKERILAILARLVCRKLRKRKRVRWMDLQPRKKPRLALYSSAE